MLEKIKTLSPILSTVVLTTLFGFIGLYINHPGAICIGFILSLSLYLVINIFLSEARDKRIKLYSILCGLHFIIFWSGILYYYNSQFYEKVTTHRVIKKEIVPPGYKVQAKYFLICEDTVIQTDAQFYFSINPPQIIYHTSEIK
jgi:hypothetical protein